MFRRAVPLLAALALLVFGSQAQTAPILTFIVSGDTFSQPFTITNNSTAGENVLAFHLDLSTAKPKALVFDTVTGGSPNSSAGTPFTPFGGTAAITGLLTPATVTDGASSFTMTFNNFGPTESFQWNIDVDTADGTQATVFGNELIGATAYVDFSNGQRLTGTLQAIPGNPNGSTFTVTGITVIPPSAPEPTSLAVFGLVACAAGAYGWRRKQSVTA